MKKFFTITAILMIFISSASFVKAQEWSTGLDIYSSYVWRGTKFGSGPAFQPSVEFSAGGLAIGAWGSYSASDNEAAEADLYASYSIDLGEAASIGLTVTDYYFPGSSWFESESHFIEPMVTLGIGTFSFTGAYMLYDGGGDIYLEAALALGQFALTVGGGDGAYTVDSDFNICNVGISTSKEVQINRKLLSSCFRSCNLKSFIQNSFIRTVGISFNN